MKTKLFPFIFLVLALFLNGLDIFGQGTAFTYQGRLFDGGASASGNYDMVFGLYGTPSSGVMITVPLTNANVIVADGIFTTPLDFGAGPFTGAPLFLDISVRHAGSGTFTTLTPRQLITPTPYAIYASSAGSATTVSGLVPGSQISGAIPASQLSGTIPSAAIGAGSISATKLASGSVTSVKIVPGAVTQLGTPDGNMTDALSVANGGDGAFKGDLTVNGGKGILYYRNSTQKMVFIAVAGLSVKNLGVNASVDGTLNWGNLGFTAAPAVFVGDFKGTSALDNYSQMLVTAHTVTTTGCAIRILNAGNASGSFTGDFNCLIIGSR